MYNILIVDDEKKEREGIALLLKRFDFPLKTTLAQNGEDALKIMEKNHFDILLTDIKMPYMDGIQLIRETQKRGWNPVCIIYSAYGEFEYAQNAISLGVQEYLLKPVKLDSFKKLFEKIVGICKEKEAEKKSKTEFMQVQEEAAQQKMSWNLLNYLESEEDNAECASHWESLENEFSGIIQEKICIPMLISFYSNLFSIEWEDYLKDIREYFGKNTVIITNTDNQIVVLLIRDSETYRLGETKKECEVLIEKSRKKYQVNIFVVLGKKTEDLAGLKKEYAELKDQLDYQFFVSKSMMLVQDEDYFLKKENDMLSLYFERIFNCARMQDYSGIKKEFVKIFAYVTKQTGFSSIYVKYTFTDAMKQISEYTCANVDMVPCIQKIYQAKTLEEVNKIINDSLDKMQEEKKEEVKENRLVRMAKELVYEKYSESDLNVSYIAEQLQVSSAYLSTLYKMETGKNLVKFITWYRVEKSKELLRQTNMKVSDVAEKVGYLNVSYYISIFRNHEGCSPVQYREREQKGE